MINIIAAVSKPRNMYEILLKITPTAPLSKEVPSNMFVIHAGLSFESKIAAKPNVQTTISELCRLNFNSSNIVITSKFNQLNEQPPTTELLSAVATIGYAYDFPLCALQIEAIKDGFSQES